MSPKTDPAELDRMAANRHSRRFVPETHPADAEAAADFDTIALKEEQAFVAATQRIDGAGAVVSSLAKARAAARAKAAAYAKIADALPSDRETLRQQADAMDDGAEHYRDATEAVARLEAGAAEAALPSPPKRSEYAQVADELKMLLNGKTREQVLDIATRPRYAGLMARDFGRAWCEANLDADIAKATHAAIVAKVTGRAGSKSTLDAKRLIAASKLADTARLRAAGAK